MTRSKFFRLMLFSIIFFFSIGYQLQAAVLCDVDNDGVTGLPESIYALRVLAGEIPSGSISGQILDAATSTGIAGAVIKVYNDSNLVNTFTSGSTGTFSGNLPTGINYSLLISSPGYISTNMSNVQVITSQVTYLETVRLVSTTSGVDGTVGGTIVNSLTGNVLPGVTVNCRSGVNTTTGPILLTTTTNSSGYYEFTLPGGNYTLELTSSNYYTAYYTVTAVGGVSILNNDFSISPLLQADEWRIVMSWTSEPSDLDSHLTLPNQDNTSRLHVFYANDIVDGANLDLDDTDYNGPETITITSVAADRTGVFRYSVHDYTNSNSSTSTVLGNSGAKVVVYRGNYQVASYNVPHLPGTLWTVFEISDISTGIVTPVNSMTFVSDEFAVAKRLESAIPNTDAKLLLNMPEK